MENTQSIDDRILPGDVVQITADGSPWQGYFGLVEAVPQWGVKINLPQADGAVVPLRMKADQIARVGVAPLMPPEIAEARASYIATLSVAATEALAERLAGHQVVMRLCGMADGRSSGFDGFYLKDFDFEAHDGQGQIDVTMSLMAAKHFPDLASALEFRNRQPDCKPLRDDGLPNRPLSATTWEFSPITEGEKQ